MPPRARTVGSSNHSDRFSGVIPPAGIVRIPRCAKGARIARTCRHYPREGIAPLFNNLDVATGGKRDAFHNGSMQVTHFVAARRPNKLRARIGFAAEPFTRKCFGAIQVQRGSTLYRPISAWKEWSQVSWPDACCASSRRIGSNVVSMAQRTFSENSGR